MGLISQARVAPVSFRFSYLVTKHHSAVWGCDRNESAWNYSLDTCQFCSFEKLYLLQYVLRSNGADKNINARQCRYEIGRFIEIYAPGLDALLLNLLDRWFICRSWSHQDFNVLQKEETEDQWYEHVLDGHWNSQSYQIPADPSI